MTSSMTFAQLRYENWIYKKVKEKETKIWKYNLQTDDSSTTENPDKNLRNKKNEYNVNFKHKDSILWTHSKYNDIGLLISEEGYYSHIDYPSYLYKTFEYDKKNRLIRQKQIDRDGNSSNIYEFTYDDKSQTVRLNNFIDIRLKEYTIWMYDKRGRLLSKVEYWGDGRIERILTYNHSEDNKIIKIKDFNSDSSLTSYLYFTFDKKNNLVKSLRLNKDSAYSDETYFAYDDNGNRIEEKTIVNSAGKIRTVKLYKYDSDDNLLFIFTLDKNNNAQLQQANFYKDKFLNYQIYYNDNGKPITEKRYEYRRQE